MNEAFESVEYSELTNIPFLPVLPDESFPVLRCYTAMASFGQCSVFLGSLKTPGNRGTLGVSSAEVELPDAHKSLLSLLSTSHLRIRSIALLSRPNPADVALQLGPANDNMSRITLGHLRPLQKHPSLLSLLIDHAYRSNCHILTLKRSCHLYLRSAA